MAPRSIVCLVASSSLAALAALALAGCLGNNAVGIDGNPDVGTLACTPGQVVSFERCPANGCVAGRVAGRMCLADRSLGPCGCYDVGSVTPPPTCANTTVRYGDAAATCLASCNAATQITSETCVGGVWSDCRCVNRTYGCAANTVTFNGCPTSRTCASNEAAGQMCNGAGTGYAACDCYPRPGGTSPICNAGQEYVGGSCNCGSGYQSRRRCNSAGTDYDTCYCVSTGMPQFCAPGSISGSCTCSGTSTGGTRVCNAAGTAYECSACTSTTCGSPGLQVTATCSTRNTTTPCPSGQVWHQVCRADGVLGDCQCAPSGGGTGASACRTQPFSLILRSTNSSLRVRCWDMNGTPVTSTTNELRYTFPGGCGTLHCVDGTGEGAGFVESGYWSTSRSAYMSERFDIVVVDGREPELRNQQSQARVCPDGARSKGNVAVNPDRLGQCNW